MTLTFQHFQTRLLVLLLVPLLAVMAAVYIAVERANTANALDLIRHDLDIGAANFGAAIDERNDNLAITGDALSGDYAFRQAFNTDRNTLLSAMNNLLGRLVTADFIAITTTDGMLLADTRRPELHDVATEWQTLIAQAKALDDKGQYPEAGDVIVVDNRPYHITVLPLLTPDLAGWISLGFEIGGPFTDAFKKTVATDVSVMFRDTSGHWQVSGSTLPPPLPEQLTTAFPRSNDAGSLMPLGNEDFVTLVNPLSKADDVQVVLQRSLAAQLAPFKAVQQRLFTIFVFGVIVLLAALVLLARNVTRPLELLTLSARRIRAGNFRQEVALARHDEFGELAAAFNEMASGLAEKERVRDLLGKVVSPEIANELLARQPELGGEEREVTLFFTDIRGFTSLCEGRSPQEILALLNEYFTMLDEVIEHHNGVVDKYIGDAVMALFGAPLRDDAAATSAVATALAVRPALAKLNDSLAERGLKPIAMGIGINTDRVVVGNMGSQSRLNYTAIGDGVNLASRLEGLCKHYGIDVIVSDSTRKAAPGFLYLPLDVVRVKGKQEPVRIFVPLIERDQTTPALTEAVALFESFWQRLGSGDRTGAAEVLQRYEVVAAGEPLLANDVTAICRQRLQSDAAARDSVPTFDDK